MIGHHKNVITPSYQSIVGRLVLLTTLLFCLTACVTETTHSVYTKEVTLDSAVQSHVDAAMAYIQVGDHENAIRHLKKANELDSRSPAMHNGLALAFQMSGETELAEKHYKAALRGDSKMTSARNNYAVFLYAEKRYPEACHQMRKVMDDTLYQGRADAFANLGKCETRLGNPEAAEAAFKRAIALNRSHGFALLELASINVSQGEYVTAKKYYQAFDALDGQNARSLYVGIQLADYFGDEDDRASYALALKSLYPHSEEYIRYKQETANDTTHRTN